VRGTRLPKAMKAQLLSTLVIAILCGCGSTDDSTGESPSAPAEQSPMPSLTEASAGSSLTPQQTALVCKAGIAKLFGQPASTIKVEKQGAGIVHMSYRRKSDSTLWKNDCKLDGNRIMWRAVDASPGSGAGRWRDDPADGVLTYKLDGDLVEVSEEY
jgi:hypothetical protein